jgi:Ca-activated chloride channel homolog
MMRTRTRRALRCVLFLLLTLVSASCASAPPEAPEVPAAVWGRRDPRSAGSHRELFEEAGELPRLHLAEPGRTPLPLSHTHVKARLAGSFAEVEVSQTYRNPFDRAIETIYVFPLPANAAVGHVRMKIGARVVEARIRERSVARGEYERAKRAGHTAALLEQERPNVFTQSVANVAPGEQIDVVVRYLQDLTFDAGVFEFVFPMAVAPRYLPGAAAATSGGAGTRADTDRVPDASRISPPVMPPGERSGHDISLELVADAGLPIEAFEVPTHEVAAHRPADGTLRLTLAEKASIPNRDFVLRYRTAGAGPKAVLYTSGGATGHFALVLAPPPLELDRLVGRREIVFVVDVSGSMRGAPLALCKAAMRNALRRLRPSDTFNVLTFSGSTGKAFPRPRRAHDAAIKEALVYVDRMSAGGGTEMADAVSAALGPGVEEGRRRYVFFLTDGLTGEEERIAREARAFVARLEAAGQEARVFGLGVGSSPNRALIESLSSAGRGVAVFAHGREDPARAVNRFFHYIDRVVVRDVAIDWGSFHASEVYPSRLGDLFASHALVVHGRFYGDAKAPVVIRGTVGDAPIEIPVTERRVTTADAPSGLLQTLWARSKIASLEEDLWRASEPAVAKEITRMGLEHRLATRFTSFVAVDDSRVTGDGDPATIVQPTGEPEDLDTEAAGGTYLRLTGPLRGAPAVRMYAVQQIYATRSGRVEVNPHVALAMNDPLAQRQAFGLGASYYLTNALAVGLDGKVFRGLDALPSSPAERRRAARLGEAMTEYAWSAAADFTWVPLTGKLAAPGDAVFHVDFFLTTGVGVISTRPVAAFDPKNRSFDFVPKVHVDLEGGMRLFFTRWLALRLGIGDLLFLDRLENAQVRAATARNPRTWLADDPTFTHHVHASFGPSVFIPISSGPPSR